MSLQDTPVRIVAVASLAHMLGGFDMDDLHFRRRSYYRLKGYGQSKLCNILFAKELARRYCFLAHPNLHHTHKVQDAMYHCYTAWY